MTTFGKVHYVTASLVEKELLSFLERGKLAGTRCKTCGKLYVPPRAYCTECLTDEVEWEELSGRGKVLSYSVVHIGPTGFTTDTPYTVCVVDLEEGGRMMAGLGEGGEQSIEMGASVQLVPKPIEGDKITLIAYPEGEIGTAAKEEVKIKRGDPLLKGKVVIITGAGRGIGKAIALRFAEEGADLVLTARTTSQIEEVAREAEAMGVHALPITCDISNSASVNSMVEQAAEKFGRIDILVNNAGISWSARIQKMTDEQWKSVIDINLNGTFYCMRAVAPVMANQKPKGGKIINFTSTAAKYGNPGQANYGASKWGIVSLTKVAAREFANDGIQVNAIMPGYIETDMTADTPPAYKEEIIGQIPLKRTGKVEDVADATLFLASDQSRYMQGTIIQVDGGLRM